MPHGEPIPPEDYATPPAWLTESCREHWDRLYRQCQALGVGPFSCDADLFQSLVVAADAVDRLGKIVAAAPVLIRNANGEPVPNSVFPRYERAVAALTRLASEFGLSPSSRSQLRASVLPPGSDLRSNPKSDLFG
jgi:P27 family predicted phage terminase small subunit